MATERTTRRPERGFTLIEVVVAFVLLSLVLATSYEIFSAGFTRAAALEDLSRATAVAQSRIAAVGLEETLAEGRSEGDTEDRRFHWASTVTRTDEGFDPSKPMPSNYALYRVDVTVAWRSADGRDHSFPLSTMMLWPRS